MARLSESTQSIDSDPDLASARLAAINQTPDAQDRNTFQEHPMNAYARNLLSPMNYQAQVPQGFNPYAAPPERAGSILPAAIASNTDTPTEGYTQAQQQDIYNTPVLGGVARVLNSPLARSLGPSGNDVTNPLNALGPAGNLAGPAEGAAGALAGRLGQGARELLSGKLPQFANDVGGMARVDFGALGGGFPEDLTNLPKRAASDAADAAAGKIPTGGDVSGAAEALATRAKPTTAELQAASDAFNKAASTTAEVSPKRPAIQTAEGQALDPSVMTRALQTAAGSEGVPLSQHPVFSAYGKGGAKVGVKGAVGGDIGTATRAVMSGDPQAMELLGPDLTQQLIQNKVAHLARQAGAPEDVVRIGLSVMSPAERAAAEPIAVATVGRNAKLVDDTLASVVAPPKSLLPDEIVTARQTLADRMGVDARTGMPLGGEGVPPTPPRGPSGGPGGTTPSAPPPVSRGNAGQIAGDVFDEVNALFRGALAGADVSTVGLQGLPLILKDLTKLPFYAVTGRFGGTQRPYVQSAFGRFFQALVADLPHTPGQAFAALKPSANTPGMRINQITQGFRDEVEKLGLSWERKPGDLRPPDIQISDPLGGISAREELTAGKIIQMIPIIGGVYRQTNFATISLLNALRVGEVRNLKRAFEGMQMPFEAERSGHLANITTGRGDLPGANGENADAIARWMQRAFFGPRLMTGAVQNVTDTILSLRNVGGQVLSQPWAQKTRLNPVDVSRIHTTASFVATGVGVMKLAEASGLQIGTDPEATDFGRITLPGGHRVDFWGPFNEEARLIARELALVSNGVGSATGLRPDVKPKYGAKTGEQLVFDYLTNKLGPVASAINSVRVGQNQAGQTPQQVIQSTIANPNPLSNPTSMVPAPFTAQSAAQAFDPAQGGQGGAQGAIESGLSALGVSVLPANQHVVYDGFGRATGTPHYGQDAVFDEYLKFHPGVVLPAPDSVLGSGHNTFPLPAGQREAYVKAIGDQRRIDLGNLIYSEEYQNATKAQQEKMFSSAMTKADATANKTYLKNLIPNTTDPTAIRAAAVTGFHAQGNAKDEAYWIATLDKAGKLTPDVKQAIEESNVTLAGQRTPITVDEYLKHAPLIHEYLAHAPFGTDKSPIGGPADWTAVAEAIKAKAVRVDELVRSGTSPSLADAKAQQEILKAMTSLVQRNLFLNGTQLENPARKALAMKYPTLKKFVSDPKAPKEDTSY